MRCDAMQCNVLYNIKNVYRTLSNKFIKMRIIHHRPHRAHLTHHLSPSYTILHHPTPSHTIPLHPTPSHSITLHQTPSQVSHFSSSLTIALRSKTTVACHASTQLGIDQEAHGQRSRGCQWLCIS